MNVPWRLEGFGWCDSLWIIHWRYHYHDNRLWVLFETWIIFIYLIRICRYYISQFILFSMWILLCTWNNYVSNFVRCNSCFGYNSIESIWEWWDNKFIRLYHWFANSLDTELSSIFNCGINWTEEWWKTILNRSEVNQQSCKGVSNKVAWAGNRISS